MASLGAVRRRSEVVEAVVAYVLLFDCTDGRLQRKLARLCKM
jgi:hypothetical protein